MNRCMKSPFAIFLTAISALLTGASITFIADAQTLRRDFPKSALRGTLVVTAPPEVRLDGHSERLSPGARIRSAQNMLVMPGALVGQELTVNYVRDGSGMLHELWILSADEAREKRAGARSLRNFAFGSESDTAPKDDGKTPFHQLPKYRQ